MKEELQDFHVEFVIFGEFISIRVFDFFATFSDDIEVFSCEENLITHFIQKSWNLMKNY